MTSATSNSENPTSPDLDLPTNSSCLGGRATEPNHADPNVYPVQRAGKNNRPFRFQSSWYKSFPWLHYEVDVTGVLCFYCISRMTSMVRTPFQRMQTPRLHALDFRIGKKPAKNAKYTNHLTRTWLPL